MNEYKLIDFEQYTDARGILTPIESNIDIPFEIKRIFYTYGISGENIIRGNHANRKTSVVLIMTSGSCKVKIYNNEGGVQEIIELNSPNKGLYIEKMVYKEMYDFSDDAVTLVLASEHFDEFEYIDTYEEFLKEINNG